MIVSEGKNGFDANLDRLMRPHSIALVGASATIGSLGESVFRNLENAGYPGELHLVNPKKQVIHGRQYARTVKPKGDVEIDSRS